MDPRPPLELYAHTKPGRPESAWEPLARHLEAAGSTAGDFAEAFGAGRLGRLAGLWHDLGKGSLAFQDGVLRAGADESESDTPGHDQPGAPTRRRVDHSTAGARHADQTLGPLFGKVLAYVIAAHHGRLADWDDRGSDAVLSRRLDAGVRAIEPWAAPPGIDLGCEDASSLMPAGFQPAEEERERGFQFALLTRMVYSALIDADRLETERFCSPETSRWRPTGGPGPGELLGRLDVFMDELRTRRAGDPAPVDRERDAVLASCRRQAEGPRGLYSLTVPTGGGKTLASLAFALTHAQTHGLRRVVYALPFTSIIEQTAETFRDIFGPSHVLEHHSGFDTAKTFRRSYERQRYERMAENFDAPVIVTTNNQVFESLFSAHGSTCRKLHRLAGSVLVLDEAQAVPPRLLRPVLAVLRELVRNYRCTVVLCTATQPALERRGGFDIGLEGVTEIVDDPAGLYERMRRVTVERMPGGAVADEALADRLAEHDAVLCIVNTRKHAAELTRQLAERVGGAVTHLSAAMCPAHRRVLIDDIKRRLRKKSPCRVVSTQVIEAGVDVDFPVVYRALAGFDSIAQAAGRCNREGRKTRGKVVVFETDHRPALSMGASLAAARSLYPDHPDPLALDAIHAYFRQVYWRHEDHGEKPWDTKDVMGCFKLAYKQPDALCQFNFRQADARFQWIDSETTPVLVSYGEGAELIGYLRTLGEAEAPDRSWLRRAQQFSVSVYTNQFEKLVENTAVTPYLDGRFWALNHPDAYDDTLGLRLDVSGWDAAGLVV